MDRTVKTVDWGARFLRNIEDLKQQRFDVLIVGGGGFGAAAAWEAVQRGYSVALIEQHDFGSGTSANSYKMVHGGIRYLQHLDLARLWSSCRERSAWMRIAPHLVRPLPIAMPTYGYGRSGKPLLGAGFLAYDALTLHRNRGIRDRARHVPNMHTLSADEVRRRFPGVSAKGLTGAAVFYDGQMTHPPRMVLAFVASAADRGAIVANYVRATRINTGAGKVTGVTALDRLTGEGFEIRARCVINGAGPWAEAVAAASASNPADGQGVYSRDTAFVIDGIGEKEYALAVEGRSHDSDALLSRGARHLFIVPWRGSSLVGVWHIVYRRGADNIRIGESEVRRFLDEFNFSYPGLDITREQIRLFNAGLVPFGDSDETGQNLSFGKRSVFLDGEQSGVGQGLLSVIGVRATMARHDASKALDCIDRWLGRTGKVPDTTQIPLVGGDISNVAALERDVVPPAVSASVGAAIADSVSLYGTCTHDVVAGMSRNAGSGNQFTADDWIRAQVQYAVEKEWAVHLSDVLLRRTAHCAAGDPGAGVVRRFATAMGSALGWSALRTENEIAAVQARFPRGEFAGHISETQLTEDILSNSSAITMES